jgi:hypothetical protein
MLLNIHRELMDPDLSKMAPDITGSIRLISDAQNEKKVTLVATITVQSIPNYLCATCDLASSRHAMEERSNICDALHLD